MDSSALLVYLRACLMQPTWSSSDGGQELEGRSSVDDLSPLRKVQLAIGQQGH